MALQKQTKVLSSPKYLSKYLQLLTIFVLPLIILLPSQTPSTIKGVIIIVLLVVILFFSIKEKLSLKELGFRTDNLKQSVIPYSLFTAIAAVIANLLAHILHKQPLAHWWTYAHLQWAFLPISFVQEFAYRAFAQTTLQKVTTPTKAILITAFLYSGMHILWKDPLIIAMTFVGGICWGYLWYKYPNLYLLTLSHSILNFLVIYLGFFAWLITQFFSLH